MKTSGWKYITMIGLGVLGAAGLRFWFVFFLHSPQEYIFSDMAGFYGTARNVLNHSMGPMDFYKPLGFPLIVALSILISGNLTFLSWLHVIMSTLSCIFAWRATHHWLGEGVGLITLFVLSLYFPLIGFSGFVLSETSFVFFVSILFYLFAIECKHKVLQAFLIGITLGACCFLKGLLYPLIIFILLAFIKYRHSAIQSTQRLIAFMGAFVAFYFMSVVGIHIVTGKKADLPFQGGHSFADGRCPYDLHRDSEGRFFASPLDIQLGRKIEKKWPKPFYKMNFWKEGMICLKEHPRLLVQSVTDLYYLFYGNEVWPLNQTRYSKLSHWFRWMFGLVIVPGILLGLFWMLKKPHSYGAHPLLLPASLLLSCIIFATEMRYRVPFDIVLIPLGIFGWMRTFGGRFSEHLRRKSS